MTYNDSIQVILDNYNYLRELVEISNSTISNEISSASYHLNVISLIIATAGVLVSGFVIVLFGKIRRISKEIDSKLLKVSAVLKDVEEVDTKIKSNLTGLYKQLREEETRTILDRLVKEPLDIHNLSTLLLSRELDESNFSLLKEAYLNLKKSGKENEGESLITPTYNKSYFLLFFQHFCKKTILDEDLRISLSDVFEYCICCSFDRDIIKSTVEMCKALSDYSVSFDREMVLYKYLIALNNTDEFKNKIELKEILQDNISDVLLLPNAIEHATKENIRLVLFNNIPEQNNAKGDA